MRFGSDSFSDLRITQVNDTSCFVDFYCGIDEMDDFIHNGLALSVSNNFCKLYKVANTDKVIALFALTFDSLYLDYEDKEDLQLFYEVSDNYSDVFWNKRHYPALEISYLAVSLDMREKGLGSFLIEEIAYKARSQTIAGCQFLTVEALSRSQAGNYSAVGFYSRLGFSPCEYPNPSKSTLRLFKPLI